ncbi:MAG: radical SAM protein [Acidobacteriota bacterium]
MKRRRQPKTHDWAPYLADEKYVRPFASNAPRLIGLAYANTYEVGMSSLGLQRTYELLNDTPGWGAERLFSNGTGRPLSVESNRPLDDFGCVAFSVSFEEDYLNLLRMLDRARVPLRREERHEWHPLIVMGGSCAAINPLPMAAFIDIFALGAAENLLPEMLPALAEENDREALLDRLAEVPGFYVPARHDPENNGNKPRLRKLELTLEQMREPGHLPSSCIVTPRTEFTNKFLVEMSRGCPEKCRYCWATFGMGKFRWHPTDFILESFERARPVTDQVGFLATAVGDHPEIGKILNEALKRGFRSSVSSIRIPAVKPEVLEPLYASGARSITLAPETGSDRLRFLMNKPIPNSVLLEKVKLIFEHGMTQLKLYFILGLPDETDDDVRAILELAGQCRDLMLERASKTGVIGNIHLGCNLLIPKPYTPWQREAVADEKELKRKISMLRKGAARMANVSLSMMSPKQAMWQTFLSRAGSDAHVPIERVSRGQPIASVMREFAPQIHPEVFGTFPQKLRWHFLRM